MQHPLLCCLLALGLAGPGAADALSPVGVARLSAELYARGLEAEDPVLVIVAARLRKSVQPVAGGEGAVLTWQEMVAAAEPLARGDDGVLGLVEDVRAEGTKGAAAGPVYSFGALAEGAGDTYPAIEFRGGEYAEVYVEAKADTNLDLTIRDAEGRLVCADNDPSHIAYCGWMPASAGTFTLQIDNKGPMPAAYTLMTN